MRPAKTIAMLILLASFTACSDKESPAPDGNAATEEIHADTPRYIAAKGGKIYVSCYNPPSVVRIDTASRKADAVCCLGNYQPEGLAIAGGKLFVASSWIADENGNSLFDNKVYVVDLASFSVAATLEVGLNPQKIRALGDNLLVVNYNGNYSDIAAGSAIIDATTLTVAQTGRAMTSMCTSADSVYAYYAPWGATSTDFFAMSASTLESHPILGNCHVNNTYSIAAIDGDIYLTTGIYNANGDIYRLAPDGTTLWSRETGIFTSKVEPAGDGTAYVLNEGSWGSSNASLDRVNLASGEIQHDVFATANGRGLGDVAQDVVVYGSKAYVTVSFSNTIEAVNLHDNKSSQIILGE